MKRMIFDVESIGLHGEGFAVGLVILEDDKVIGEAWAMCDSDKAAGTEEGRAWVSENCLWAKRGISVEDGDLYGLPLGRIFQSVVEVREWFWGRWLDFKSSHENELWADVAWPVEGRFLIACVEDARAEVRVTRGRGRSMKLEPTSREWEGPFPLCDVEAVARVALKRNLPPSPDFSEPFLSHHPLSDARASSDKLIWAERRLLP